MHLDFEKPAVLLLEKIQELRAIPDTKLASELGRLERKLVRIRGRLTARLSPMEVVQLARHPLRPYAQEYISGIFRHIEEIHGIAALGTIRPFLPVWAK